MNVMDPQSSEVERREPVSRHHLCLCDDIIGLDVFSLHACNKITRECLKFHYVCYWLYFRLA
jgi:hypothetical protein